jgi:membrane-bound lytic murein transglycosylase B
MRLWTAGSAPDRPAHVTAWARFPRWSSVAVAAAVPAVALIAYATPLLHGSVRHDTAAATSLQAAQPPHHDDISGPAAAPVTESTPVTRPPTTAPSAAKPTPTWQAEELAAVSPLAADGIPQTALAAYRQAAKRADSRYPTCELPWPLLAAIGRVESDHGRYAGAVLYADGTSSHKILGIPLDGTRSALIRDTDNGRLDGDTHYDRAVGPMQFIPSTWKSYAVDGNGDGRKDPFNIFDAAAAAADYLCTAGGDLGTERGQIRAVLAYNHSSAYVSEVLALEKSYAAGVGMIVPVGPHAPKPPKTTPRVPPVDPGPPLAHKPHHGKSPGSGSPTGPKSSAPSSSTPAAPTSSAPSTAPRPSSSTPSSDAPSSCASTSPIASPSTSDTSSDGLTDVPSSGATDSPSEPASDSGSESGSESGSDSASDSSSDSPSDSASASANC